MRQLIILSSLGLLVGLAGGCAHHHHDRDETVVCYPEHHDEWRDHEWRDHHHYDHHDWRDHKGRYYDNRRDD